MYRFSFEKLDVWKEAKSLTVLIYSICQQLPSDEKYNLSSQTKRASISVLNNIAEGAGRINPRDQARFTEIAYASLMEVFNCVIVSYELNYYSARQVNEIREKVAKLSSRLINYRNSQLRRVEIG